MLLCDSLPHFEGLVIGRETITREKNMIPIFGGHLCTPPPGSHFYNFLMIKRSPDY